MKVLSAAEIRALEECAVDAGVSWEELMENAGAACADHIREITDVEGRSVVILCGKGNNGGDGFVIARLLNAAGAEVSVVLMQGAPSTELSQQAYDRLTRGINIYLPRDAFRLIDGADIIVDAIFGFGFKGTLPKNMESVVEYANAAHALRISVDIPSGAECDTGAVTGVCFKAEHTVTFTAMKPAGVIYPAAGYGGKTVVRRVGIKDEFINMMPIDIHSVELSSIRPLFPKRDPEGHKGTYGRLLLICGSVGMAGAAIMAARAALRSGVGLLNIAIPHPLYQIMSQAVPEAVFTLYDTDDSMESCIGEALSKADVCLIGCGLGTAAYAERLVEYVLKNAGCRLVLDADALNIISASPEKLHVAKKPVIITPHPGEMSRLCGRSISDIARDRIGTAKEFAAKHGAYVVLKGAGTVTAAPDGEVFINTTGNPGMAKGGSGDVLAGIVGSLSAQGMRPLEAAYSAVYIHGAAGDICAEELSQHSMLPTDIIDTLPKAFLKIEKR